MYGHFLKDDLVMFTLLTMEFSTFNFSCYVPRYRGEEEGEWSVSVVSLSVSHIVILAVRQLLPQLLLKYVRITFSCPCLVLVWVHMYCVFVYSVCCLACTVHPDRTHLIAAAVTITISVWALVVVFLVAH